MSSEQEIAKLVAVHYDGDEDDVFVKFKVCNDEYKDFVLRWARSEEGRLVIRGDALFLKSNSGEMRTSRRE